MALSSGLCILYDIFFRYPDAKFHAALVEPGNTLLRDETVFLAVDISDFPVTFADNVMDYLDHALFIIRHDRHAPGENMVQHNHR